MHLLINPKYFVILLLVFSFSGVQILTANTNPRELNKRETKEEKEQQVKPLEQQQDQQEQPISEESNKEENEASDASKSSFNYLFYLIYKVKFEDVFKFPDRRGPRNSAGITLLNINSLLDRLAQPNL